MRASHLAWIAAACLGLSSCAKDKAGEPAVAGPTAPVPGPAAPEPVATEPAPGGTGMQEEDGIRLPNLLGLPEDKDLRSRGSTPKPGGDGVISKPPVEKPE